MDACLCSEQLRYRVLLVMAAGCRASPAPANDLLSVDRHAVKSGNSEAVRAALKQHVDVERREADGMTALHWAVARERCGHGRNC